MSLLNINLNRADQLKTLKGSTAELRLISGDIFSGTVKEVSNTMVLLAELSGEEYYSALIVIETIIVIKIRTS